jgi:hypothetical protein
MVKSGKPSSYMDEVKHYAQEEERDNAIKELRVKNMDLEEKN